MRKRVPDEATCAICGRHFDPSETRGWCPNPSCGEWQHPSFPVDGGAGDAGDANTEAAGGGEPTATCPECGNEVPESANFCDNCANPLDGGGAPEPGGDAETGGLQCPDCGFDLSGIPTEQLSTCPVCMYDVTPVLEEGDEDDAGGDEPAECPNCGEDLRHIPSDRRTVCPGCRIDLDETAARAQGAEPQRPEPEPSTDAEDEGKPIESVDAVATGYEPRLREAGVTTESDLLEADPDDLSTKTGISARRIRGWIEDAGGDAGGAVGSTTGGGDRTTDPAGGDDAGTTEIRRSPDELVLEVRGREVSVADGQTVGAEIRSAMVEAGASEQDAVYVHRKHVRIDATDGGFHLTRLGENSLEVNGRSVEKGERVPISDGDEVTFSGVVTATVSVR